MGNKVKLFHHDKALSGIDISPTGIKVMAIDTKKMSVQGYGSVDLDPFKLQESMVKGTPFLAQGLQELLTTKLVGKLPSNHVALSIPTSKTYSRMMTIPISAIKNLRGAIELEAEQYIPIPASELNLDYQIIEKTDENVTVLLSAVPKRIVETILAATTQAGLEVIMIEPGISSLARIITRTEEGHLPTVLVDIGSANTDIGILDKYVRVTGGVSVGGNTFTLAISRKMKVSLETAHQLKVLNGLGAGEKQTKIISALQPELDHIGMEIQKIIRYYSERIGANKRIEQVIIVGGGSSVPGLGEYFTDSLVLPARVASPWQMLDFGKLPQPSKQFKPRYITCAGLASIDENEVWSK